MEGFCRADSSARGCCCPSPPPSFSHSPLLQSFRPQSGDHHIPTYTTRARYSNNEDSTNRIKLVTPEYIQSTKTSSERRLDVKKITKMPFAGQKPPPKPIKCVRKVRCQISTKQGLLGTWVRFVCCVDNINATHKTWYARVGKKCVY